MTIQKITTRLLTKVRSVGFWCAIFSTDHFFKRYKGLTKMLSSYYTEYVAGPAGMTTIIRPREITDTFEDIFNVSYSVNRVVGDSAVMKYANALRTAAGWRGRIRFVCWKFTYSAYYNDDKDIIYQNPISRALAFEKFSKKAK